MSHAIAHHAGGDVPHGVDPGVLSHENIHLAPGAGRGLSNALLGVGLLGLVGVAAAYFTVGAKHALASYVVAVMSVLAMSLGAMFLVMVSHLTNAGWSATLRRQVENIMALAPACAAMALVFVAIEVLSDGVLLRWLDPEVRATSAVLGKKVAYLNVTFFLVRAFLYVLIWTYLARRLWRFSRTQDATGDRRLTAKARRTSAWGILVFALSVAFAAFDWLMSMDLRFFSTMWGVYYFAGAAYSGTALVAFVLATLGLSGKLRGVVTREHFHDLGKLLFSFTVFWAYIAFSQYFLIWYANLPEETMYMAARKAGGWGTLFVILCLGHFIAPFLILLFRAVKKNLGLVRLIAAWMIAMEVADMAWIVRPMVHAGMDPASVPGMASWWVDAAAIVGVFGVFGGLLVRRIASGPLIPLKDPRQHEALAHRNYI